MVYELDKKYIWNKNFQYSIPASEAAKCFHDLESQYGEVTAEKVVSVARNTESVLHPCFEWDNVVAAEKYRRDQASAMIRNLYVVNVSDDYNDKEIVSRAYVNITNEKKGRFVNEQKAMSDVEMRNFVLKQALKELQSFKAKYENLQELAALFVEIDKLI